MAVDQPGLLSDRSFSAGGRLRLSIGSGFLPKAPPDPIPRASAKRMQAAYVVLPQGATRTMLIGRIMPR